MKTKKCSKTRAAYNIVYSILTLIVVFAAFPRVAAAQSDMDNFGKLIEFKMTDNWGDQRNVQVFVPHNYDYRVPAKVVWYFRGTNGIYITWNIESTRLYKTAYEEKAVIVAPDLFQKTWSRGDDDMKDYHFVNDLIDRLKTLRDDQDRLLNLDFDNMLAIGFSGGGGFVYNLSGRYPLLFYQVPFKKYVVQSKVLDVTIQPDGSVTGNTYDVGAVNKMKAAYEYFSSQKPPFQLCVGANEKVIAEMQDTTDVLLHIGLDASLYIVANSGHKFFMDHSPEFKATIKDFLFPMRFTKPDRFTTWHTNTGSQKEFQVQWSATSQVDSDSIDIQLYSLPENRYIEVASGIANSGSYMVNPAALTDISGKYFLRITTADNMDTAYSTAFNIDIIAVTVDLQASRKEERAWLIGRQYGEITLSAAYAKSAPVAKFVIYRKEAGGEYAAVTEIPAADLTGGNYTYFDKFLQDGVTYTYKAAALNAAGVFLAVSPEKSI